MNPLCFAAPGNDQDYLLKYQKELESVDIEAVKAAGKRHLHPGGQVVVIVGDATRIEKELVSSGLLERHGGELRRLPLIPPEQQ